MKTNKWIYGIVIAALGWVACDDDDNKLVRPSLNETDETFLEVTAKNNLAVIEFGELATTKASDSIVRDFAQRMIEEHTTAQNELEEIADDYAGVEWSNDLSEGNDEIMEQLNDVEGYSFDSLYMRTQVDIHTSAENIFRTATTNTTEARVKAYATKYLPRIEAHVERADSIHTVVVANRSTDDMNEETDEETEEEAN